MSALPHGSRLLLLSAIAVLAACPVAPPGSDAGTDAGATLSAVELCDRLAAARCRLAERCYPAFLRADATACASLEQASCLDEVAGLDSPFQASLIEIDAARLASCEVRMATSACPPSFPPDYFVAVAKPMADCTLTTGLLSGKVASGDTCVNAAECAAGSVCIKPGGVCRGTCSSWPKLGDPCGFGCAPGSTCNAQGVCAALKGRGETCQASKQCEADLICLGTCLSRRSAGQACSFDPDRLSQCDPGLACDVAPYLTDAQGVCVVPKSEGSLCHYHWSCQPGLVCADMDWSQFPNKAPGPGSCRAPDAEKANCPYTPYAAYVGDQCGAGLSCAADTKTCAKVPVQGEPCTPSVQNCAGVSVYCKPTGGGDVGVCSGPVSVGDRCAFQLDATRIVRIPCATGACDAANTLTCRPPSKSVGAPCAENGECLSNRCAVQQDRTYRCANACG